MWRRLAGFGGLPLISLVTPVLVLPVLARAAGAQGWSSVVVGESIGTIAAIVIAYGWNTMGPARIAAMTDPAARRRAYGESLDVRVTIFVAAVPVVVGLSWLLAAPGYEPVAALMGISASVTGLSFAWYCVGVGDPRPIATHEAIPRVGAAAAATAVTLATGWLEVYPILATTASCVGMLVFSRRVMAGPLRLDLDVAHLRTMLVRDRALAVLDVANGLYSNVPSPLVQMVETKPVASAFASADKLYKFGSYVPITLANAFQSWTVEGEPSGRARRLRSALAAHAAVGLIGAVILAVAGPLASRILFGADVQADRLVCVALAAAFALFSVRTSMTRHVLIPAGQVRVVLVATVASATIGTPLILLLVLALGPAGAALGLVGGEVVAAAILTRPTARRIEAVAEAGRRFSAGDGPQAPSDAT